MKRLVLVATSLVLLLAPTAGADTDAPDPAVKQRHHREILVRGVVLVVSPVTVRASIGALVTCEVRDRKLVAGLAVGDRVRMKCIGVDGRWFLRRITVNPTRPPVERVPEQVGRSDRVVPAAPTRDGMRGSGS